MTNIDASWLALDGSGITVTVADTGLDNGVNNSNMHPDFIDHIVDITSHPLTLVDIVGVEHQLTMMEPQTPTQDMALTLQAQFLVMVLTAMVTSKAWLQNRIFISRLLNNTAPLNQNIR